MRVENHFSVEPIEARCLHIGKWRALTPPANWAGRRGTGSCRVIMSAFSPQLNSCLGCPLARCVRRPQSEATSNDEENAVALAGCRGRSVPGDSAVQPKVVTVAGGRTQALVPSPRDTFLLFHFSAATAVCAQGYKWCNPLYQDSFLPEREYTSRVECRRKS